MTALMVILVAGIGSYLFRVSMIGLVARVAVPASVERASAFVAPTAFAALAATGVVAASLGSQPAAVAAPLGAVAGAMVAVWLTRRPYAAPLVGMPLLWLLTALVGA